MKQPIRKSLGFTLIEVMIVVAIIGILAAIAYPSYTQYVIRGKRVDAQSEMLQIAQAMQNYKLRNGNYTGKTVADSDIYGSSETPKQGTALYTLAFSPPTTTANTWTLIATPKTGQSQAGNGALSLNSEGAQCWYKNKDSNYAATDCKSWNKR